MGQRRWNRTKDSSEIRHRATFAPPRSTVPKGYHLVASASSRDLVITEIAARHSMISSAAQMIIDVVVKLEPRKMGVPERYFVEVDVTGLYPYALTTSMQPFIDVSTR